MADNHDDLIEDITRLSPTLFAATVAGSAFLYSISLQFEKNGLPTSAWIEQVHMMSLAGLIFILCFGFGLLSRWAKPSHRYKEYSRGISLFLFLLGLVLVGVVSYSLWINTF